MQWQQAMYNGYKRAHGFHFQGLTLPDGSIAMFHGPFEETVHDMQQLRESKVLSAVEELHRQGHRYSLYADSGYELSEFLFVPFKGAVSSREQRMNSDMSAARVAEHSFCQLTFMGESSIQGEMQDLGISDCEVLRYCCPVDECLHLC